MSPILPSVPSADHDLRARADAIHRDRNTYRFDHSWEQLTFPHPDVMIRQFRRRWFGRPAAWPRLSEQSAVLLGVGATWMAHSAPLLGQTAVNNKLAATLRNSNQRPVSGGARRTRRTRSWLARVEHMALGDKVPDPTPAPYDHRTPSPLTDFHGSFTLIDEPPAARHWAEDWWFARERVAGCNPVNIELVRDRSIFVRIPLSADQFETVRPGDDLDRALAEHRLYAVDFAILDGLEAGVSFGWQKYLCAPIALLVLSPDRAHLWPVAIQCGQDPSKAPVITPAHGMAWQLAKVTFNAAESNYHGIAEHGAFCHIMIGALAVALRRTLAPWHPIRVLLEPNIEYTIAVSLATKNLFEPGGRTPNLQAVTPAACAELVRRAWKSFDWTDQSGGRHFERRGVDDADAFPGYIVRDDIEPLDAAIRSFVGDYVALYYSDDDAVADDHELQSWREELACPEGADQPSVPELKTRAALIRFLADVIWRASPYHAVINYSILDGMGFVPNMPTAVYAPPPDLDPRDREYDLADLLSMLPPIENCDGILEDVVHVSGLRLNKLGHYPSNHFLDPKVGPLVEAFQAALRTAGTDLDERNRRRTIPYTILHPDNVTASIHI